jgi:hypothetical protein
MRRILIAGALAVVLAACAGNAKSGTTPTTAETNTINGTFALQGSALTGTEVEDSDTPNENFSTDKELGLAGNGCQGTNGYDDIAVGLQVIVSDGSGTVIANSSLEQGQVVKDKFWNNCEFPFTVSNVPTAKFYKVQVGGRGQVSYSYDQMQANGWKVRLSLG